MPLRTRIRPSLWYSLKCDSSEKTRCLQWWSSQSRCRCDHCRQWLRRFSLVSLGHLVGLQGGYSELKVVDWWCGPKFNDVQSDDWTVLLTRDLIGNGCKVPFPMMPCFIPAPSATHNHLVAAAVALEAKEFPGVSVPSDGQVLPLAPKRVWMQKVPTFHDENGCEELMVGPRHELLPSGSQPP